MYGTRIRERRKRIGLTMKELGEKINAAESTVSGYESETRKPDIDTLKKIAFVLETNASYLLGETDDPSPPDKKGYSEDSDQSMGLAFITGGEDLSEEEAEYLKESLELFRRMKERKAKEREKNK